eukprot:6677462-Pyramimonas_sp.AAC.1
MISGSRCVLLIASRPSMAFPSVIKTAPRHPNMALMYPIMIEGGPAAGGEALADMTCAQGHIHRASCGRAQTRLVGSSVQTKIPQTPARLSLQCWPCARSDQ